MSHSLEVFTASCIADLRQATLNGMAVNNAPLAEGIYFSWDDEHANIALTLEATQQELFSAKGTVEGTPEWFSLNITLGQDRLEAGDVLGVVIEAETAAKLTGDPFVRSAWPDGGYVDTEMQDTLDLAAGHHIQVLLHTVKADEALTSDAYLTLVLPLPHTDIEVSIKDIRIFVIEANRGFRSVSPTVSDFS